MLAVKTLPHKLITFKHETLLMGTRFEFSVVGNDPHWADDRIQDAVNEVNRVEKLISAFNDESSVNEINRNAGIKPVKTNAEIFRLINRSLQISELTDGSFDITYYTVDKEKDQSKSASGKKIPQTKINYQNVILDEKAQTVFLANKNMRIGFGSNSKGYAADKAKYVLQLNGVSSGVINAGGDLITWGLQPDSEPCTVAAADPGQEYQPFANVAIGNMAIATSVNTVKYTAALSQKSLSAIDHKAGFPVSGIKSVSILSTTAELADSLSATVMQMGINAGLYLINQLNQIACVIIDDQDRVYTSKNINVNI
jgi:FAD:protein FMN transferase